MLGYAKTRFHAKRLRLEQHAPTSKLNGFFWEIFLFFFKLGWACLFGGILLGLVLLTKWFWPHQAGLPRYDFLFLSALTIQILLLVLRMETLREAKVILVFHLIGTLMELFKTHAGSWVYPEPCFFRIGQVPLFSGFMYASVGSFIVRCTRILDMRYTRFPSAKVTAVLATLIYVNFFSHHFLPDIRIPLFIFVALAFGPTTVYFRPYQSFRRMPLLAGLCLVALFIWVAENIGTFAAVWVYPSQHDRWHLVDFAKFGSWLLLMIVSFILISLIHPPRLPPKVSSEDSDEPAASVRSLPSQTIPVSTG